MFHIKFVPASSGQETKEAGSSRVVLSTKHHRLLDNTNVVW
jgi:hypothetical protein